MTQAWIETQKWDVNSLDARVNYIEFIIIMFSFLIFKDIHGISESYDIQWYYDLIKDDMFYFLAFVVFVRNVIQNYQTNLCENFTTGSAWLRVSSEFFTIGRSVTFW